MDRTDREFEGRDLEGALREASQALGIAEPDLDYKILEQGRRGLFGLGARPVRIRVMPPVGGIAEAGPAPQQRKSPGSARSSQGPKSPRGSRGPRPPRGPRNKSKPATPPGRPAGRPAAGTGPEVQATVAHMVELMGLELSVSARSVDGGIAVDLGGADRNLLMRKDGELISALQFLLNRMARRAWPGTGRIHLACDGNRKRRDDELVELTREVARQVASTGKTQRLHPMNAYERRMVHITVREFPELDSRSEGNGFLKRVRVFSRR